MYNVNKMTKGLTRLLSWVWLFRIYKELENKLGLSLDSRMILIKVRIHTIYRQ